MSNVPIELEDGSAGAVRAHGGFRWLSRRGRGRYGTILLGAGAVLALFGKPWIVQGGGVDLLLELAGWVVFLCGAFLRMWAMLHIGGRKGKVVLDRGPYALVRHPLYVGSFLIALSAAMFLDSVLILAATLLTAVAYELHVIPREEERLSNRLGEDYVAYCRRTNRYVPRIAGGAVERSQVLMVDTAALARELSRAFWWMLLPLFVALAAWLRVQPWWPHVVPLP